MTLLKGARNAFVYLLHETGLTKGNLATHLAKLEAADYLSVEAYRGRVPLAHYRGQRGRAGRIRRLPSASGSSALASFLTVASAGR